MPVRIFEAAHWGGLHGNDAMFFDEEGLFKGAQRGFVLLGLYSHIVGKGLIVGADNNGNPISAQTPLSEIRANAGFTEWLPDFGFARTSTPWEAEPDTSDIPEAGENWFRNATLKRPE